jgi:hypothetical protein
MLPTLREFIKTQWPISVKLFRPLFGVTSEKICGTTVYAIKSSTGVWQGPRDLFIFVEKDGSRSSGNMARLAAVNLFKKP